MQWWFPKQLVDDSWRITAAQLPPTSPGRFRDTRPWWGFWVAFSFILSALDRVGIVRHGRQHLRILTPA